MSLLVVLRHAKSAWPDGVPDAQRPLTARGRRDAPAAGRWLREHVGELAAAACSPAVRAQQTWRLVAAELDPAPAVALDDRIYAADPAALLAVVRDLPAGASTAAVVGHNPGLEDLVALLGGTAVPMRTAALAVLRWPGGWDRAGPRCAELEAHATPRG